MSVETDAFSLRVERAKRAWELLRQPRGNVRERWLEIGAVLVEGRKLHKAKQAFSAWCEVNGFGDMKPGVRSDVLWAFENEASYNSCKSIHPTRARSEHRKARGRRSNADDGAKSHTRDRSQEADTGAEINELARNFRGRWQRFGVARNRGDDNRAYQNAISAKQCFVELWCQSGLAVASSMDGEAVLHALVTITSHLDEEFAQSCG